MDKNSAEKVAQWWVDRMDAPHKFDVGNPKDEHGLENGRETLKALGFKLKPKQDPTPEQKEKFKEVLVELLLSHNPRHIRVVINPNEILEQAIEEARIRLNPFPLKTYIDLGTMKGHVGYGGKWEDI
jgi:hypothetical protein